MTQLADQSAAPNAHGAPPPAQFFITGGTLRSDAACYVTRQADRDLHDSLMRGELCYLLTSRQMGKSSLMVRVASRLRGEEVRVAVLDLTAIGQNLTPEQWYEGLLGRLGRQLGIEDELEEFWLEHERLGPLQRWMAALERVVLPLVSEDGETGSRAARPGVVVFIDEIDAVRSLSFSTDEFFAAIRECYNRRAQDPRFNRLTFCLLGVATPGDLIRDVRTTPFNIGRRVELADISLADAEPLAHGIAEGAGQIDEAEALSLVERVLHWTGGQPYLTQRLCKEVAGRLSASSRPLGTADVDAACEALFLTQNARETDDNLVFVRERILRSEADRAALLDLYGQVRSGKRVPADETEPLVGVLRLSGIVRNEGGTLRVRNRIYAQVFDRDWIATNMPDAEVRRQRAAYRAGVRRTLAIAGAVLALLLSMLGVTVSEWQRANRNAAAARTKAREAEEANKRIGDLLIQVRDALAEAEEARMSARAEADRASRAIRRERAARKSANGPR